MKEWPRAWKVRLIERGNPEWEDLYDRLYGLGHWVPGTSPGTTAVAVERECALLGELHQRPFHHVSGAPTCPTAASSSATPSMPFCCLSPCSLPFCSFVFPCLPPPCRF